MRIFKEIAYQVFVLTGLTWLAARLNRGKILVLAYHDVYQGAPQPVLNFDGLQVRVDRFERQMRYLRAHYRVVPLQHLLEPPPDSRGKALAAITIDDGYKNTHRYAFPVLRRLGLPATVFVITEFFLDGQPLWWNRLRAIIAATRRNVVQAPIAGRERWIRLVTGRDKRMALRHLTRELRGLPPQRREALLARMAADLDVAASNQKVAEPLTADELRELVEGGVAVGSHGRSHESFLRLSQESLVAELIESRRMLESVTARPVRWLAYPYGDFSREAVEAARETGYLGAMTTIEGLNDGIADPYAVRRIGVDDHMTLAHFIVAVSGLRDVLKNLFGFRWVRRWVVLGPGRPERTYAPDIRDHGAV